MYGNTELSFKVNLPIDDDELSAIRGIITYLQSLVFEKEKDVEKEKEIELVRKSKRKVKIVEPKVEESESEPEPEVEEPEEPKVEVKIEHVKDKCYVVRTDGSIDCNCGSNMELKNLNRHIKTAKHLNWLKEKK